MKVGITGQSGFIGYHLSNYLSLKKGEVEIIPFDKSYFSDDKKLEDFLLKCDVVVHLAGINRGSNEEVYNCNVRLASQLTKILETCNATPQVLFASSLQEGNTTPYGRAKKEVTTIFINWAKKNKTKFTSLIIPNVFGPFCKPYYNSVVATFSHQLTHCQETKIDIDGVLKLIYVGDLVEYMYYVMKSPPDEFRVYPQSFTEIRVSEILSKLSDFRDVYLRHHIIPALNSNFDIFLFNTFRSYISLDHFPISSPLKSDERGDLAEVIKERTGGQVFYSFTKTKRMRGNHYHRRKIERFFVVNGVASLKLRKIGSSQVVEYILNGDHPSYVDIPVFYTHNITNIGESDLVTIFWANELFKRDDPDTYYEAVSSLVT